MPSRLHELQVIAASRSRSGIVIPQADAIERAFAKLTNGGVVVTDGGQHEISTPTAKTLASL